MLFYLIYYYESISTSERLVFYVDFFGIFCSDVFARFVLSGYSIFLMKTRDGIYSVNLVLMTF